MSMIFFTFRAQLQAKKAAMILNKAGIRAKMGKTPAALFSGGCGFGIWVPEQEAMTAAMQLRGVNISYEKSFAVSNQAHKEVFL